MCRASHRACMVCELRFGMCDRIGITLNRFLRGERCYSVNCSTFERKIQALGSSRLSGALPPTAQAGGLPRLKASTSDKPDRMQIAEQVDIESGSDRVSEAAAQDSSNLC